MMSHRSSRRPARPRRGPLWLAPRRCKVRQGQRWHCWGNWGSPCRAGRWRLTPSRPLSCDMRRRSPASQTPQILDRERKDRDPPRWEPVERRGRSQWQRPDDEWLIIISNRSMFPHRLDQTVGRASFLCQLSAELRGNSEGGVRSVGGRSYNTTSHMIFSDTQQKARSSWTPADRLQQPDLLATAGRGYKRCYDTLYVTGTERADKSGSYRNTSVEPVVCMQNTAVSHFSVSTTSRVTELSNLLTKSSTHNCNTVHIIIFFHILTLH